MIMRVRGVISEYASIEVVYNVIGFKSDTEVVGAMIVSFPFHTPVFPRAFFLAPHACPLAPSSHAQIALLMYSFGDHTLRPTCSMPLMVRRRHVTADRCSR